MVKKKSKDHLREMVYILLSNHHLHCSLLPSILNRKGMHSCDASWHWKHLTPYFIASSVVSFSRFFTAGDEIISSVFWASSEDNPACLAA